MQIKRIFILLFSFLFLQMSAQTKKDESDKAINSGIQKYNDNDFMGAIAEFTRAIRLDPENPLAYYNRGLTKFSLRDYNGAVVDCNDALKFDSKNANIYNIRGLANQGLQNPKEATQDFNKAIKLDPKSFIGYFNRGNIYYQAKDNKNAIEDFTKSISLNQEHEESYQNRGLTYYAMGEYDKAVVDFSQAIYLNPKKIDNYLNRGSAKTNHKDYEGAIEDYNEVIKLNPKSDMAYFNLGVCYANLSDTRMSCVSWTKAMDLGNKDAKDALKGNNCLTSDDMKDSNGKNNKSISLYNSSNNLEIVNLSEEKIREYLDRNSGKLDAIEGIWSANSTIVIDNANKTEMPNYARVAVIRDTTSTSRDFIMVMLEGKIYTPYTVIAEFINTAYPKVYLSQQYALDGSKESWNFTIDNVGLLSGSKNSNEGKTQVYKELYYVKVYPKGNSVKTVEARKPNGEVQSTGTGFVIAKNGVIATNAHVVGNFTEFKATFLAADGKHTYKAKVLFKDVINDVALLAIDDATFTEFKKLPYKINEDHSIGENVFTIGFPLTSEMGEAYKVANGIVSALSGAKDDIRYMQITVPLQPGNSGGPLFNKNGDVIGVTSARLDSKAMGTDVQNVNYALKISYLLNLIKMVPNFQKSWSPTNLQGMALDKQVEALKSSICLIKTY